VRRNVGPSLLQVTPFLTCYAAGHLHGSVSVNLHARTFLKGLPISDPRCILSRH
jgi:hypothetical protein